MFMRNWMYEETEFTCYLHCILWYHVTHEDYKKESCNSNSACSMESSCIGLYLAVGGWTNYKIGLCSGTAVGTLILVTIQQHFICNSQMKTILHLYSCEVFGMGSGQTDYGGKWNELDNILRTQFWVNILISGSGGDGHGRAIMSDPSSYLATDFYYPFYYVTFMNISFHKNLEVRNVIMYRPRQVFQPLSQNKWCLREVEQDVVGVTRRNDPPWCGNSRDTSLYIVGKARRRYNDERDDCILITLDLLHKFRGKVLSAQSIIDSVSFINGYQAATSSILSIMFLVVTIEKDHSSFNAREQATTAVFLVHLAYFLPSILEDKDDLEEWVFVMNLQEADHLGYGQPYLVMR
ncbi:uncharacterized protein LOC113353894 isoform X1 [Papaver somniferum]|uniref:uncharacterized protein LOC113353894 isoform X1 n=1 Tax=Papaver somniferum TaxID=3469 RepID=UPI000E6F4FE8|nr:uncharacterized protein LOC113353894 isoform X1 [Papaver somniferum]